MIRFRRSFFALGALALLSACAETPARSTGPAVGSAPSLASSSSTHLAEGMRLLRQDNHQAARARFQAALAADSSNWRAWNAMGISFDLIQSWAQAADAYRRARDAGGNESEISNNEGVSLLHQRRYGDAEIAFHRALSADAGNETASNNLALALAGQGKYEEVAGDSSSPATLNNIGYMAMIRGDLQAAELYLTHAVQASASYNQRAAENLQRVRQMLSRRTPTPPPAPTAPVAAAPVTP